MALTSCVRCRTSNSRAGSTIASACCSAGFTGTLGMSGRAAASLIASASLRSLLPRRTNGLTYCGGISCTIAKRSAGGMVSEADLVAHGRQLAAPMVRAAACLQCHMRRRQLGEERLHLGPPHVAAQDGPLVLAHAMQGEHGLGRVEANALEVHADGPSGSNACWCMDTVTHCFSDFFELR